MAIALTESGRKLAAVPVVPQNNDARTSAMNPDDGRRERAFPESASAVVTLFPRPERGGALAGFQFTGSPDRA